jgi:hypothetical protein
MMRCVVFDKWVERTKTEDETEKEKRASAEDVRSMIVRDDQHVP